MAIQADAKLMAGRRGLQNPVRFAAQNVIQRPLYGVWSMKRTMTILTFLAALPSGAALAGDDCAVPLADWQPRSAVVRLAEENGWVVRRIKIDDGCYKIKGTDREGRRIEVMVDPGTLQVMDVGYGGGDDRQSPEGRARKHDRDEER